MIIHKPIMIAETIALMTDPPSTIADGYAVSPFRVLRILFQAVAGSPLVSANQNVRPYWWYEIPGTAITGWYLNYWASFTGGAPNQEAAQTLSNVFDIIVPRLAQRVALENTTESAAVYATILGWTDRKEEILKRP